ncbi:MAG TPA: alanine--glyoxylate aminotransferase family protein, partial [Actinomycetota bacterium]|nr:alanine--glyoxylate aminotransferase family protein [Actinomycetota bacterium]
MEKPEIIMAPGPTPVPPEVLLAQGSPLVYHRGPGYGNLLREVTEGLQKAFRTKNDVLIFASSGTGGLESAVANLFSPGDRVIAPVAGYFGDRFARIAQAFGQKVERIDYEWGRAVRPEDIEATLTRSPE